MASRRLRFILINALFMVMIIAFVAYGFVHYKPIGHGWSFLNQTAGFPISESFVFHYSDDASYLQALFVGVLNTFKVSVTSLFLATILGFVFGYANFYYPSPRNMIPIFINSVRGVPLLIQLLLWYAIFLYALPSVEDSIKFSQHIYFNQRGLFFPWWSEGQWQAPELVFGGRNIRGGSVLTPEFMAMTLGLSLYSASYISEIVRGGLLSIPRGLYEASYALGLSETLFQKHVGLPVALKVVLPPYASQALTLVKASSLGIIVGYPDLVSVGGTTINQSGQVIEVIMIWMFVYFLTSFLISVSSRLLAARFQ